MSNIPFNRPWMSGEELELIRRAHEDGHLSGDGNFTRNCSEWIEGHSGCQRALLTHSCTAALEMAAILVDIQPGDEVIMPSYTFVSTANAFVLRGGVPVFVDVREDTLNIDETLIEQAITQRTRAIVPVHYAGVGCDMDVIMDIADRHQLVVIEDAAQGIMSTYHDRSLGAIGQLGCYSFHETKNVISGEGGALLVNDERYIERAEIIREKGTNRKQFFRGQVDKYTWCDIGSSFLPGELIAAFLYAQLQKAQWITDNRLALWNSYHALFEQMESDGLLRRPQVPVDCRHNAHMYYILLADQPSRDRLIGHLKQKDVHAVFHYIPLHSSPAGSRFGREATAMHVTDSVSSRVLRLPMWLGLTRSDQEYIATCIGEALGQQRN